VCGTFVLERRFCGQHPCPFWLRARSRPPARPEPVRLQSRARGGRRGKSTGKASAQIILTPVIPPQDWKRSSILSPRFGTPISDRLTDSMAGWITRPPSAEPTVGHLELRESSPGGQRGLSLLSPIIERRYRHAKAGSTRRARPKIARCRLSQIFIAPGSTAGWQMAGTCLPP
jgi:hypothetical protein